MSEGYALTLTTSITPAKKFLVDGDEYELLGLDHLSPDDEAKTMALFARHQLLASELEMTSQVTAGTATALKLKKARIQIICMVTTLPEPVASKIPVAGQVALLSAIQQELSADVEDAEDADEPTSESPKPKRQPVAAGAGKPSGDDED